MTPQSKTSSTTCRRPTCPRTAHRSGHGYCEHHAWTEGVFRKWADPEPARQHITTLGVSLVVISEACGVSHQTLYNIRDRKYQHIRARVSEAILNTTFDDLPVRGQRPAWPAMRRLQALRAAGWTLRELAALTGMHDTNLANISLDRYDVILASTDQTIRDAYTQAGIAVRREPYKVVKDKRWHLPAEWSDIDAEDGLDPDITTPARPRVRAPIPDEVRDHLARTVTEHSERELVAMPRNGRSLEHNHRIALPTVANMLGVSEIILDSILRGRTSSTDITTLDRITTGLGLTEDAA